jgi:hypothetical protein
MNYAKIIFVPYGMWLKWIPYTREYRPLGALKNATEKEDLKKSKAAPNS